MPGAGTKAISTGSRPAFRLLDLTRLLSRVGRGALTGVDRVERAYLDAVIGAPEAGFGLIHTPRVCYLLDDAGLRFLRDRFDGVPWGTRDAYARLHLRLSPERQAALSDVRRYAMAQGTLAKVLERLPSDGGAYFNVGHSNLRRDGLATLGQAGLQRCVMIHDTIPLDYPQFQAPDIPDAFREKLDAVLAEADLILANSQGTAADLRRHASSDPVPPILVAPLGVSLAAPDAAVKPPPVPYFLTLGTIEPRKNHGFLLDLWEDLARDPPDGPMPQLHIIGARGWANEAVFQRLDTSPLMGKCVFEHGSLPDSAVAAWLSGATGLLFPSHAEGYGLPPLEAIAHGKTPICAPLPIYQETLGNMAIYAPTHDVYLWRQQILNLVRAKQAGQDANQRERATFQPPSWADHFSAVFAKS